MQVAHDEKQAWREVLDLMAEQVAQAHEAAARGQAAAPGHARVGGCRLRGLGWHDGHLAWHNRPM